jgi:hypothetical protein
MKYVKDELPRKGKDIIGYTSDGEKHYVFRCNCYNPNCTEWRCSITGFGMMLKIVKWEYEKIKIKL